MKIYMEKKERESNIELLRIISMVLVMVVHADFMALGIPSQVDISDFPVSSFMRLFTESVEVSHGKIRVRRISTILKWI